MDDYKTLVKDQGLSEDLIIIKKDKGTTQTEHRQEDSSE